MLGQSETTTVCTCRPTVTGTCLPASWLWRCFEKQDLEGPGFASNPGRTREVVTASSLRLCVPAYKT